MRLPAEAVLARIEGTLALVLRRLDQLTAPPPTREPERWLTIGEAAERVGLSRATFDRLRARGAAPPCALLGSATRYRASDVDSWAAKRVVGPAIARPRRVA